MRKIRDYKVKGEDEMTTILSLKGVVDIVIAGALYVLSLSVKYYYMEISLLLLLIVLFIIDQKTEKRIVANIFGNLLIIFFLYPVPYISDSLLFNIGIVIMSLFWIIIFNRYFKLDEEERLPLLEVLFKRRKSFETIGILISLGFLKLIFDLQIMDANITISKEVLSNLYSINFQLFGIILTGVIMIAVFVAEGHGDIVQGKEQRKKKVLAQSIKGVLLFAIPIIFLSVLGIISNMNLYIGQDMSSFQNTIVTWIFSVTVLLSIFCILFIGMLIYDLLEIKGG